MIASIDTEISIRPVLASEMSHWQAPWTAQAGKNFMQQPAWLLGAWNDFHQYQPGVSKGSSFCGLLATTQNGEFAGCSSWFRQFKHGIHWWQLVGSGSICSDYVTPAVRPELEHSLAHSLAEHFDRKMAASKGFLQALEIEGHTLPCNFSEAFNEALVERGWWINTVEIEGGWRLDLPREWADYEQLLQKSRRRKARRALRLMEKGEIEWTRCSTPQEIADMWPEFVRLHQSRREQLGQPGCFADLNFERFLKNATLELASSNSAWLSVVQYQSKPLAILLMFDAEDTAYMYQSGCDPNQIEMEPGHLVNAVTIHHCISSGQRAFDFMRGDERYKSGWQASRIPLYRTRLFPPSLTGKGIASVLKLRERLRTWL